MQSLRVAERLEEQNGIKCEVIDLRQINPLDHAEIVKSVNKTGLLCVVDGITIVAWEVKLLRWHPRT